MVIPAAITRRARPRVTSACDKTGEGDRGERGRQPGQAGLQRGVTEYLLHVEGADKDEREEAAAEQHADRVRAVSVLLPKIRSGISGACTPPHFRTPTS